MQTTINFKDPAAIAFLAAALYFAFRFARIHWMLGLPQAVKHGGLNMIAAGAAFSGAFSPPIFPQWIAAIVAGGLFLLQTAISFVPGPRPHHPEHYLDQSRRASGRLRTLYLVNFEVYATGLQIVYQCSGRLAPDDADRLDTRLRAYIACIVPDAARRSGVGVTAGPPHGQRPSWILDGFSVPVSLQKASFDAAKRVFGLRVGPIMLGQGAAMPESVAISLGKGFLSLCAVVRI